MSEQQIFHGSIRINLGGEPEYYKDRLETSFAGYAMVRNARKEEGCLVRVFDSLNEAEESMNSVLDALRANEYDVVESMISKVIKYNFYGK